MSLSTVLDHASTFAAYHRFQCIHTILCPLHATSHLFLADARTSRNLNLGCNFRSFYAPFKLAPFSLLANCAESESEP